MASMLNSPGPGAKPGSDRPLFRPRGAGEAIHVACVVSAFDAALEAFFDEFGRPDHRPGLCLGLVPFGFRH